MLESTQQRPPSLPAGTPTPKPPVPGVPAALLRGVMVESVVVFGFYLLAVGAFVFMLLVIFDVIK